MDEKGKIVIEHISAVIIVKNGEDSLKNCLESLKEFQEVILYENGSTDNTVLIAHDFPNVTLIKGEFLGFGKTKNKAASYAKNDWIFSLDADEVLNEEMILSLKRLHLSAQNVYSIERSNYYHQQKIKHCGWNEEEIVRLYNKAQTAFNDNMVHEKIMTQSFSIVKIDGELKHYPYASISHFIQKIDHYSTLFAKEHAGKRSSSPTKAFSNAIYSFFRTYFLRAGFLDGYAGLLIAFSHMSANFYKYMKLYEANQKIKHS